MDKDLKKALLDLEPDEESGVILAAIEDLVERAVGNIEVEPGEKGDKGDKGDKGERGSKGEKGERGLRGEQGVRGYRGEKGENGEKGDTGDSGKDGETVTLKEVIETLQPEIFKRIPGGGSMNRQIFVGGSDPLKRYTDINIKAGSNVTLTTVNNDTTRKVDLTIASSGGGGGTVRSINSVSTATAAGSTAGTDYVYLCSGTMTITLPDATTNTNLYTIKNTGTGVITIATTSAQTIDAQASIQLGTQYTSVDLISDTANWNLT